MMVRKKTWEFAHCAAVHTAKKEWKHLPIYNFTVPAKRIFESNILLIICCAFYLAWWLLAFKPNGAIKGMKTGWLLIPAFAAGLAAIIFAVRGITSSQAKAALFPNWSLLLGDIALYIILLFITRLLFKRPVTTELFLIVGWAALALSEIDTLYGIGVFSHILAVIFVAVVAAGTLMNFICYMLYYNLGKRAGYFDGMIPLIGVALITLSISIAMLSA
jgi:hypothetical protein